MKKIFLVISVIFLLSGLVACNHSEKLFEVQGICTYNGEPVEGVSVIFVSNEGKPNSSAYIQKEGKFTIIYKAGVKGIHNGSYVTFFHPEMKPNKAGSSLVKKYPPKYSGEKPVGGLPFSIESSNTDFHWDIVD